MHKIAQVSKNSFSLLKQLEFITLYAAKVILPNISAYCKTKSKFLRTVLKALCNLPFITVSTTFFIVSFFNTLLFLN